MTTTDNLPTGIARTPGVLKMVMEERIRQELQYGDVNVNTPAGTGPETRWLLPYTTDSAARIQERLREDYEAFEEEGPVTWVHLIREEISEAFERAEGDPRLVPELVQSAALLVSFIERLLPS